MAQLPPGPGPAQRAAACKHVGDTAVGKGRRHTWTGVVWRELQVGVAAAQSHGQSAGWLSLAVCRTEAGRRPFPGRKWTDTGLLWTLCNLRRLLRFHPAPLWAGVGLPVSLVFSPSLPTLPHSGVLCAVL